MQNEQIIAILRRIKQGELSPDDALAQLAKQPSIDIGHTVIDSDRLQRTGQAEVIYGAGKSAEQIVDIIEQLDDGEHNILATRVSADSWQHIKKCQPSAQYNALGRVVSMIKTPPDEASPHYVAIVSAGTSDAYVVEEAYETVRALGVRAIKVVDVGVAGIHRLLSRMDDINRATVIIVVAGMEGALASVVGGLTPKPVIAVPTSVGYGASFGGISALLTMLNSCASGVSVVNIDNGFGAAYSAVQIVNLLR